MTPLQTRAALRLAILPLAVSAATLAPGAALAYVGPGAGLSLLGALWALIAALGMAVLFIVAWPLRRALRRRRNGGAGARQPQSATSTERSYDQDRHATPRS